MKPIHLLVRLQAKLFERLEDHLGQLCAEMRTAREQFMRKLGKRKHEDEGEFTKASVQIWGGTHLARI